MTTARRALATEVAVGAHVLVKPGEQVALDGEIVHGRALVSAEHITGRWGGAQCRWEAGLGVGGRSGHVTGRWRGVHHCRWEA